jgi:hypothetical protein
MTWMTTIERSPPRRRRGRSAAVVLAIVLAIVLAVTGYVAVTFDPLRTGSVSGTDPSGLLATIEDHDGGVLHLYKYAPGVSFLTLASIRNDGPIAITLLGLEAAPANAPDNALIWPDTLLLLPDGPGTVGPDESVPFAAVAIEPGRDRAVWIRWRVGTSCVPGQDPPYPPESGVGLGPRIPFRWSILWVQRTSEIDLGYSVEAFNPPEDPLAVCPG